MKPKRPSLWQVRLWLKFCTSTYIEKETKVNEFKGEERWVVRQDKVRLASRWWKFFDCFMCDSVEGVWPRVARLSSVRRASEVLVLCLKVIINCGHTQKSEGKWVRNWCQNGVKVPYISAQWCAPKACLTWHTDDTACWRLLHSIHETDFHFVCFGVLIVSSRWRQEQAFFFRWVKTFFWTNCGWRGRRTTHAAQLSCVISCISS